MAGEGEVGRRETPPPVQVATAWADCASVVSSAGNRPDAIAAARPFAGLWLQIPTHLQVNKTKAHRTQEQAEQDGDLRSFLGNALADSWAKKAAKAFGPSDLTIDLYTAAYEASDGPMCRGD